MISIIYLLSLLFPRNSFIGSHLYNINYSVLILTQYLSNLGAINFYLKIIKIKGYQLNIEEKINICFQFFFIIFSLLVPFFVCILVKK